MTPMIERAALLPPATDRPERRTFADITAKIPEAVSFAKSEAETADIARTPEGKFALTFLLATRNLLRPALADLRTISPDLTQAIGGPSYNPERSIDRIGSGIALELSRQTTDIPHFFMSIEDGPGWESVSTNGRPPDQGERFAVVDPLDMTSSIAKNDRIQTTGIAIYTRDGTLLTVGIMSLVDDAFVFIEQVNGKIQAYPYPARPPETPRTHHDPLRIAAKTRRLYAFQDTPLMSKGNIWTLDCDSGYAVLGLYQGTVDTVVDHIKGNPWYELAIWVKAAQMLGMPVTDKDGNALDISAVMRRVIQKHEGDSYRIPFVISRTPEIHSRVLSLLRPQSN